MKVRWRLAEFLQKHDITPYRLVVHNESDDELRLARGTVYAIVNEQNLQVSLETLTKIVTALRELTGKPVTVCDILEYL